MAQADPSSPFRWSFDVFLSFRGEDTRSNFVSHLNMALRQNGINVFIDYKLPRGESISASLLKTIEESRISIVIFSKNYASSSWCLDELVKIIEGQKCNTQMVFPIFYKVAPSNVGKQTGSFKEALTKHERNRSLDQIQVWREALTAVSKLSGWDLHNYSDEASLIQEILQKVLNELNRKKPFLVARYPVGIDSQMQDMNLLSRIMSDSNTMIGIYGIGGMGKTTLAKALYNKIAHQFEGCSFLANVREASKQFDGLIKLQERLLSDILKGDLIKISHHDRGINIIKDRLRSKKTLLVLDNVDTSQQLEVLAGGRDWFRKGSKVIVTTRNKHLLSIHKFDLQHPIKKLSNDEALELFSWHVFQKSHPPNEYLHYSIRAVNYCKCLPLALVVLGSFFCGRDESTWEYQLGEYERKLSLDKGIRDILQISYDGLDDQIKEIFLDISCFLIGKHIDDAKTLLEACGLYSKKGITNLMDLSLLTINKASQKIEMHDLIQEMGRTIASSESTNPCERKRLFTKRDVEDVFNGNEEAKKVKAIKLNFDEPTKLELDIDARGLENLKNLTFIEFQNVTFSRDVEYLPHKLKWIDWPNFPTSSFPSSFTAKNLIQLRLQCSSIKDLGKGFMNCKFLKNVDLSRSEFLDEIPDFSSALNLEKLKLEGCLNLKKVHESIGSLGKLVKLWLAECVNLTKLPNYLKLRSLTCLNLRNCIQLEKFPEIDKEIMQSSQCSIYLSNTAIRELPSSIKYLTRLKLLSLGFCPNLKTLPNTIFCLKSRFCLILENNQSFCSFPNPSSLCSKLTVLHLYSCNLSDVSFLEGLSHAAPSLEILNLSHNKFSSLPSCIVNFKFLSQLLVHNCKFLKEIVMIPVGVEVVDASGCTSLVKFPENIIDMISYDMKGHDNKTCYSYLDEDIRHYTDDKDIYRQFENEMLIVEPRTFGIKKLILMNYDIPEWYDHKNEKKSITFCLPRHQCRKLKALAPCVVFQLSSPIDSKHQIHLKCEVYINNELVFHEAELIWIEPEIECTWLLVFYPKAYGSRIGCESVRNFFNDNSMEIDDDGYGQLPSSHSTDYLRNHCDELRVSFEDYGEKYGFTINYRRCGVHVVYKNDE